MLAVLRRYLSAVFFSWLSNYPCVNLQSNFIDE